MAVSNTELRRLPKAIHLSSYIAHDPNGLSTATWCDEYGAQVGVSSLSQFIPDKGVGNPLEAHSAAAFEALKNTDIALATDGESWEDIHFTILSEFNTPEAADGISTPTQVREFIEEVVSRPLDSPIAFENIMRRN
ncbi:hypothetical protein BOTBODRAFT_69796 [Botryobasidium botryosum FD-172 SS1]|uniref:Uncharacterized protein n=1 Tax=Botryobasidium botryosum (strain FD-172 SS1) TaxID=930990 RepID=A0A067LYB0_BOTB1|nr:hypothetical protein BOTBODRAFT_69796 [Botryobasidium botryosum FD-172 SS1]